MGDRVRIKADLIRLLRLRRGWTATDLMKQCGLAQETRTIISRGGPIAAAPRLAACPLRLATPLHLAVHTHSNSCVRNSLHHQRLQRIQSVCTNRVFHGVTCFTARSCGSILAWSFFDR